MRNHSLTINTCEENVAMRLTGVTGVKMLVDKEAHITLSEGGIIVKGSGLTAGKLDVESGIFEITATVLSSVLYTNGGKSKPAFKDIFK